MTNTSLGSIGSLLSSPSFSLTPQRTSDGKVPINISHTGSLNKPLFLPSTEDKPNTQNLVIETEKIEYPAVVQEKQSSKVAQRMTNNTNLVPQNGEDITKNKKQTPSVVKQDEKANPKQNPLLASAIVGDFKEFFSQLSAFFLGTPLRFALTSGVICVLVCSVIFIRLGKRQTFL